MSELNPCPFCKNSSTLETTTNNDGIRVVFCHRCGCKGPQYIDRGWSWSTRIGSTPEPSQEPAYQAHAVHDGANAKVEVGTTYIAGRTFWDWLAELEWPKPKSKLLRNVAIISALALFAFCIVFFMAWFDEFGVEWAKGPVFGVGLICVVACFAGAFATFLLAIPDP